MGYEADSTLQYQISYKNFGEVLDIIQFTVNFSSLWLMKNSAIISGFQI